VAGMGTVGWFNVYTRLAATVVAIDTQQDFYTAYHQVLDDLSRRGYVSHPPPVSELEIENPRFGEVLKAESWRVLREHPRATLVFLATAPISILTQDNTLGYVSHFIPLTIEKPPFSPTLYASQHGLFSMARAVAPYLASWYIVPYFMRLFFALLFVLALMGAARLYHRGERALVVWCLGFMVYIILLSANAGAQIDGRYRTQFLLLETALALVAVENVIKSCFPCGVARTKRFLLYWPDDACRTSVSFSRPTTKR
jgi:hypothetical protein